MLAPRRRGPRAALAGVAAAAAIALPAVAAQPQKPNPPQAVQPPAARTPPPPATGTPVPPPPATPAPGAAPGSDDGQWTIQAKDPQNTRFSGLADVTAANVAGLKLAWTFSTGVLRGHEAAPLVVGTTMYLVTPFPNYLYAIDLATPGGALKWKYDPQANPAAQGVACCDLVNRGPSYADGKVVYNTLDGFTVAVDAATGTELWKTKVAEFTRGETLTMSPLVAKGKVFVGNSGGEMGVRGNLTALDLATGRLVWRAWSTGPDEDVLIGPGFKPFYAMDRGKDLGVASWPPEAWKTGGGTVWGWVSYDPELDLLYYGTGNPGPWNHEQRPGDNKWTCGIFARKPDTGEAVWYYQTSPHDTFDHDGINESVLVDLPVGGPGKQTMRKVMLRAERNGYLYVIDRATGQVLSATPFVPNTASLGVDLRSGRLIPNKAKEPKLGEVVRDICPAAPGAKDWQPTAWSPRTRLLYIPHNNLCMSFEGVEANYIAGTPFVGANVVMYAGPGGNRGFFTAWDPVAAKPAWQIKEKFPVWSGALATAGDVVFYGTMEGWAKAVDARTGRELWKFKTGSGIIAPPMTYRGPDGRQYVAFVSGVGGWSGAIVAGDLDPRDATAALGFANAMRDLPQATAKGGMLYVFALP